MRFKFVLIFLLFFLLIAASSFAESKLRFAVTDVTGLEELQREFGAFKSVISKHLGAEIEFFPITSRTAAAEAIKNKKLDFVLTGPAEYVIIRERAGAKPIVGFSRPDYYSAIVVLSDSPIRFVKDLIGQKIGLGEVGSTSYYLAPLQLLKDGGVDSDQVKKLYLSKQIAWQSLKRKHVAAIGMNHERFQALRANEKTLAAGSFRVIARGPDLPNDLIVAGKHVSDEDCEKVRNVFGKHSDELVAAIMKGERNDKYSGMKFITGIRDSDYDYIRRMFSTAGYAKFGLKEAA